MSPLPLQNLLIANVRDLLSRGVWVLNFLTCARAIYIMRIRVAYLKNLSLMLINILIFDNTIFRSFKVQNKIFKHV
jgi:hypothetical protein